MKIDLAQFRAAFFEEALEHQAALESGLLALEREPADREALDRVFRAAHSIKGGSGTFGLTDAARFTHVLEALLDRLRAGQLQVTPAVTEALLRATDMLREVLAAARSGAPAPEGMDAMMAALALAQQAVPPAAPVAAPATVPLAAGPGPAAWRVGVVPHVDLLQRGQDPLLLLRELESLGTLSEVVPDLTALPALAHLDPERCYLGWSLRLAGAVTEAQIREVFQFVEDTCDVTVAPVPGAAAAPAATSPAAPVPEPPADVERRQADRRLGDRRQGDRRHAAGAETSSIRVATEKVDQLIDLVGELVIAQSMVASAAGELVHGTAPRLLEAVALLERNTRMLQERVMAVRMVPVAAAFSRFPRMVRDLASRFGKDVVLETAGEEIELDKSVIEGVTDPLTHLVRNAVDHGVETAAARTAAGKPAQAVIRLSAMHEGGSVVIEVADDGAGLDTARIRAKALERGLLKAEDALPDEQVHQLIFAAGFSTADVVSDVSGRGVGLDVVRRNVEALNGSVAILTEPGRGTRFRIKLPLTLAILDGLTLGVGGQTFILPLLSIVESLRPAASEVKTVLGQGELVMVRGEPLPLLRLHELFGIGDGESDPTRALVVIMDHDGERLGLLVDQLLGQSQVVIKNLEANYRKVDGVMGATILGDGNVALILDAQGLARQGGRGGEGREPRRVEEAALAAV